jgi:hypothetical protein
MARDNIEKYTGKIIHIIMRIHIHSSFCVPNFMVFAGRPNFFRSCPLIPHTSLSRPELRYTNSVRTN